MRRQRHHAADAHPGAKLGRGFMIDHATGPQYVYIIHAIYMFTLVWGYECYVSDVKCDVARNLLAVVADYRLLMTAKID